jgi:hypothetical protein
MELEDKILTMASFKGGENSTDPRRCTAHSRRTGKRCKNKSILGGRVYRSTAARPRGSRRRPNERLRELEYPAVEAIGRILEPPSRKNRDAAVWPAGTILNASKIVLDRTLDDENKPPVNTLIDVSKVSTPLLADAARRAATDPATRIAGGRGANHLGPGWRKRASSARAARIEL